MKKILIICGIFILVLVGTGYLFAKKNISGSATNIVDIESLDAWVEVTAPNVFSKSNAGLETEVKTGDTVTVGETITTSTMGTATIHFPDGSELRLDNDTAIVLSESSFPQSSIDTHVSIVLSIGRVWSKVVALASPASLWEVTSSNAVATVRGTAFSMERRNNTTKFIGVEHTIEVHPIDQKTGKRIDRIIVPVTENKILNISDNTAREITEKPVEGSKFLIASNAGKELLDSPWVTNGKKQDDSVNKIVLRMESFRAQGKTDIEVRKEIRKELRDEFNLKFKSKKGTSTILEKQTNIKIETPIPAHSQVLTPVNVIAPVEKKLLISEIFKNAKGLRINTVEKNMGVSDGEQVHFSAYVYGDQSEYDVTKIVTWESDDTAGAINSFGVFTAKLNDRLSEIGEGTGTVTASFNSIELGAHLISNPVTINVHASTVETGIPI